MYKFIIRFVFILVDADIKSEPVRMDKHLRKYQVVRLEFGFKNSRWITVKHFWPKPSY